MNSIHPMLEWNAPIAKSTDIVFPTTISEYTLNMFTQNIPIAPIGNTRNAFTLFTLLQSNISIIMNSIVNRLIPSIPEHGDPIITPKSPTVIVGDSGFNTLYLTS